MKKADIPRKVDDESGVELVLKILLVGAPKSGKTSFVRRLSDKPFREEYVPTLGFDIIVVPYGSYQGRPVSLHLWDVAGSQLNADPCHHALMGSGAEGVLYVLDVTSRESLQAIDQWDRALSKYLPPWSSKLLVGHKADLPVYVVNDEALSLYVAGAQGFRGWCLTVGNSDYGDYDVAARRGGVGARGGDRYKGQSLSGEKQLSVSEATRMLIGHVFRAGSAGVARALPASVVGLGASPAGSSPLPPMAVDATLESVRKLGLGSPQPARDVDKRSTSGAGSWEDNTGDMRELLRRGRGPGPSWPGDGRPRLQLRSTPASAKDNVDSGWKYFAGRMGREEAETLLRGRPEGTFFLRRKSPSVLVLTYVAKVDHGGSGGGGGTSSRKSIGAPYPPTPSTSDSGHPAGEDSKRRATFGGEGGVPGAGAGDHGGHGTTFVQHALLVYEGGCFSDEKARLGRFSTLEELLKSKISVIARYPLSFRREQGRYLLDEEPESPCSEHTPRTVLSSTTSAAGGVGKDGDAPASTQAPTPVPTPVPTLVPVERSLGREGPRTLIASFSSMLGSYQTPDAHATPLPLAETTYVKDGPDRMSVDKKSRGRAVTSVTTTTATTSAGGASIVDRRDRRNRRSPPRQSPPATGESMWMAAAAAVQKTSKASSGSAKGKRRTERRTAGVGGRARTSSEGMAALQARRQRSRRESASSAEEGSVSSSATESTELDRLSPLPDRALHYQTHHHHLQQEQQQQQHYHQQRHHVRRGSGSGESSMAQAAEAAALSRAAVAAASSHPTARLVLERLLTAESTVDAVADAVESHLQPVAQHPTPGRGEAAMCPPWSPRASSMGGTPTQGPRLDAAAALLMRRACSSREMLVGSMNAIRERVLALAVADAGELGSTPTPLFPPGLSRASNDARDQSRHSAEKASSQPAAHGATDPNGFTGLDEPGLSTCRDFDFILTEAEPAITEADRLNDDGRHSRATVTGRRSLASDSGGAVVGSAMEGSSWLRGQGALDGTGRGRQRSGSPGTPVTLDSWPSISRALSLVEARSRAFVSDWESAAAIMADACDEDFYGSDVSGTPYPVAQ